MFDNEMYKQTHIKRIIKPSTNAEFIQPQYSNHRSARKPHRKTPISTWHAIQLWALYIYIYKNNRLPASMRCLKLSLMIRLHPSMFQSLVTRNKTKNKNRSHANSTQHKMLSRLLVLVRHVINSLSLAGCQMISIMQVKLKHSICVRESFV